MRASRVPALLAVGVACLLAACSGSTSSGSPAATTAASQPASVAPSAPAGSPAESAPASVEPTASAASGTLDVTAKDFAFDLPATVTPGVTTINLTNSGAEEHQAQLVKINEGHTLSDVVVALNSGPAAALSLVSLEGGPNAVVASATGSSSVNLEAGQYAFICFISGADGVPHFAKGMIAPLTVTGTASAGTLPTADANLTLKDFSFDLDKLSAGKHTIAVKNSGPQPHEATLVKLNDGVTIQDILKQVTATPAPSGAPSAAPAPPPFTEVGGLAAITPGVETTFDVDLPAGNYAFVCFVPDAKTGAPHIALGMIGALTVQ